MNLRLYQKRQRGHQLINILTSYGMSKSEVYAWLAKAMKTRKSQCHFAKFTEGGVDKANGLLQKKVNRLARNPHSMPMKPNPNSKTQQKKRLRKQFPDVVLSREKRLAALAALKKRPWWKFW